jgi:hypothetical protein
MTDRQDSKYDQHPLQPSSDDGGGGNSADDFPDKGKDFSGEVPTVTVNWSEPPSFNDDPPQASGDGNQNQNIPPAEPFRIDLTSMRTAEEAMLSDARTAVDKYEQLRQKVLSQKDTIFGQKATHTESHWAGPGTSGTLEEGVGSQWSTPGVEFASVINPLQEKVLGQIASILESTGEYIATINMVGQMYAQADRHSVFPDTPAPK